MQIFRLMQDFCNKIRGAHIAKRIFIYAKEGAASPSHLSVATPTSLTKLVLVLFFFFLLGFLYLACTFHFVPISLARNYFILYITRLTYIV